MIGLVGFFVYGVAGIACLVGVVGAARLNSPRRKERRALVMALAATAGWCTAVAAFGVDHTCALGLEILRNLAWIYVILRLFSNDGRHETLRQIRPLVGALVAVELLQVPLLVLGTKVDALEVVALLRMLVAAGALVLMHNFFGGATDGVRRSLAWACGGITAFWAFELNYYTIAYLTGYAASELNILRAILIAGMAIVVAIGASRNADDLTFRPSRAVTFSTLSLVIVAVYFLAMVGLANGAARLAGDLARLTQVGFLLVAAALSFLWLPSTKLRRRARAFALKHLFRHRYDYRTEWVRFTHTIGSARGIGTGLHERAIQSLADIADSPAGLLLIA